MLRRMEYQIAFAAERGVDKNLAYGLDWDLISGTASDVQPTEFIGESKDITIDGINIYFYLTPDTETKAHLNVYVRDYKILYLGDNSLDALHNVENIRGIPVRDAGRWGDYINHLANEFGDEAEVIIGGHGYPHFNREDKKDNIKETLLTIATAYKYINNEALHLENKGVTINELNKEFKVPDELARQWYVRQQYGNWSFNARAVVQKYSGFFDGNPVNLNPLSKAEFAEKIIEYVGSEEKILEKAKEDYLKGEYQWVAEITSALVFRNPSNTEARFLNADALEQLGFQSETATWRNAYLTGAAKLRDVEHKLPHPSTFLAGSGYGISDILKQLNVSQSLDHIGIALDGSRAGGEDIFTLSGNDRAEDLLKRITGYIVDFSEFAEFAIIE